MPEYIEEKLETPLRALTSMIQKGIGERASYFGIRTLKNPMDAWVYQEILFQERPDVVVEIGNAWGGSALYIAHLLDLLGHGRVVAVDVDQRIVDERARNHPRILFLEGDASDRFDLVRSLISEGEKTLVIEDSSHTFENTLKVLRLYSRLVGPGGYLIVEDSICHHGLDAGPQPGPWEAIDAFLAEVPDFESDRSREHFLITWNPRGYLRRRQDSSLHPKANDEPRRSGGSKSSGSRVRGQLVRFLVAALSRLQKP